MQRTVLVSVLLVAAASLVAATRLPLSEDEDADRYALPEGLLVGAGVSAIQTEGAWNVDGKAESAADHVIHTGKLPTYASSTLQDTAVDSYHFFKQDVEMAAKLKLKMYKFSMSWSRILPEADATKPNKAGVDFYNNLLDEIIKYGMTPMVTMYHFDHPQLLEDQFMGWQNRKMVDKFAEYAKFVFDTYGSKVKHWITINEPNMYCTYFTALYVTAGLRTADQENAYDCIHNNLLAHKEAYRIFKKDNHDGLVGYSALLMHARPSSQNPEDVYAADVFNQLHAGSSLHPVVYGDYPEVYKNLAGSKLTAFTEQEKADLKGSVDFVGLNTYFTMVTAYNPAMDSAAGGLTGMILGQLTELMPFVTVSMGGNNPSPLAAFTTIDPAILKNALLWCWQTYKVPIVITENGFGDGVGMGLQDNQRAAFFSTSLRSLVATVKDYGVKVLAYSAWSLVDSFEFSSGFKLKFGLVHVDIDGGTMTRSLKESSKFWVDLADTGVVPLVLPTTPSPAGSTKSPTSAAPIAASAPSVLIGLIVLCLRFA